MATEPPANRAHAKTRAWAIVLGLVMLIALGGGALLSWRHRRQVFTEKDTIVLANFVNKTDDPALDGMLRQGLAVQLEQSPFLSLISDERVLQVLRLMGKPIDAPVTPEMARDVCKRTGSSAVLYGSIATLGSQYVLGLRAEDCRSGKLLAAEQVQADRKEDLLIALDQIASKFRTRVGESSTTIEKYDMPLAEATTPSLPALEAYSAGLKVQSAKGSAAALPLFKRAIALDPKFAMAYANQGHIYGEIGESDLAAESMSKAYTLQDRASEAEKYFSPLPTIFA